MKFGILTYHEIPNFGAVLQGYALCTKLREMSVDCEIVDYECANVVKRELVLPTSGNAVKQFLLKRIVWPQKEKKITACRDFIKGLCSSQRYTRASIAKANEQYDGFVSGSDMIWNLDISGEDYTYFLDFADDEKKKIAFSSSAGQAWNGREKNTMVRYLNRFEMLSVREKDTCEVIQKQLKLECELVCDPTMLLSSDEWNKIARPIGEKDYILVYFPYPEILAAARKYAKRANKKVIVIETEFPWRFNNSKNVTSPEEWISYIKNAYAIFTDSYHGLLFALYFHRPVWTNNKCNRIASILDEFNLKSCYIENDPDFTNHIDFDDSEKEIARMRKNAEAYIKSAFKV